MNITDIDLGDEAKSGKISYKVSELAQKTDHRNRIQRNDNGQRKDENI